MTIEDKIGIAIIAPFVLFTFLGIHFIMGVIGFSMLGHYAGEEGVSIYAYIWLPLLMWAVGLTTYAIITIQERIKK